MQIKLFERLCKLQFKQVISKNLVHFFRETIPIYQSVHLPFTSLAIVRIPMINSIWNPSLQQELYVQQKIINELAGSNQLDIYMTSLDEQTIDYEKKSNSIIDQIWTTNKSLPSNQQLTSTMLTLIDQRFQNITAYIACLYKFKRQLIHLKLRTDF